MISKNRAALTLQMPPDKIKIKIIIHLIIHKHCFYL